MTGSDRYSDAGALLREAHEASDVTRKALALHEAQVHATLALAAATALSVVAKYEDTADEIRSWARLLNPDAARVTQPPENWPPQPGDVWRDELDRHWACLHDRTLACTAMTADDTADEINRVYGPMTLVSRHGSIEVPF